MVTDDGGLIDPSLILELLNGTSTIVEVFFLMAMARYLVREHQRRKLVLRDWFFRLPESMHFAVATVIFDAGILIRAVMIWVWRRFFDAGDFSHLQAYTLLVGAVLITFGGLCKIRSVTKPFYGNWPWAASAVSILLFLSASLYFR